MRRWCGLFIFLLCTIWVPARAQMMDHGGMDHAMPDTPQDKPDAMAPEQPLMDHHSDAQNTDAPTVLAPAVPTDHAADAFYDPNAMARARAAMGKESGGMAYAQLMLDRFEYRAQKGDGGYAWEGEGWIGGDIHRLTFKTQGEGDVGGRLAQAEVQAVYSRAIGPWYNLEAGIRQDFRPAPHRTYAVIGIKGLAPYWFKVGAHAFVSDRGDAHLRLEGSYDQRLTQRLILQPAAEVNIAAQDVPELGMAAGLTDIELGLRLRYEIARTFAPYIGVNWERRLGGSAAYARAAGLSAGSANLVMGIRFWF